MSAHAAFALACACGVAAGGVAHVLGRVEEARLVWAAVVWVTAALLLASIVRDLLHRKGGVDLIALLAMAGAIALGELLAGAVIALMYASGLALEDRARRRARRELSALLARAPKLARRHRDGALEVVAVEDVRPGDRLLVAAGEPVPVDALVRSAAAVVDESALTGESLPVRKRRGDRVSSGALNAGDAFDVDAVAIAAESTYANVVRFVEHAQAVKAPLVRAADRYALVFVPATLAIAGAAWAASGEPVRALAVLVVATPCPLLLAAPVAVIAGISRAARRGILVKDGAALETLACVKVALLDKTGTITRGRARLAAVETRGGRSADDVLRLAACADQASQHVLAQAVVAAARERGVALAMPADVREQPGSGVSARVDGHEVRVGSLAWVAASGAGEPHGARAVESAWARGVSRRVARDGGALVFVALDGEVAGALVLADRLRPEAPRALRRLRRAGIERLLLVSGDRQAITDTVALALGFDAVLAERSALDKVDAVRAERDGGVTMMVGDGVNDAPALAAADVGVAMGARGSAVASQAAAVVLVADDLDRLADAVAVAARSRAIAVQSMVAGMSLSGAAMVAASFGLLAPVVGAVVQELIDVAVILNALRAVRAGRKERRPASIPPDMAARLQSDHDALAPVLDAIRDLADRIDTVPAAAARAALRELAATIRTRLLPHELADEQEVYPYLERSLEGTDPLAAMSRTHREIHHLARRLDRCVEDLDGGESMEAEWARDARRTLYALDAVLRLHFAQEEELYAGMTADPGEARAETAEAGRSRPASEV